MHFIWVPDSAISIGELLPRRPLFSCVLRLLLQVNGLMDWFPVVGRSLQLSFTVFSWHMVCVYSVLFHLLSWTTDPGNFFYRILQSLPAVHLSRFGKLIPDDIAEFRFTGFFGFSRRYSGQVLCLYAHNLAELPFYWRFIEINTVFPCPFIHWN